MSASNQQRRRTWARPLSTLALTGMLVPVWAQVPPAAPAAAGKAGVAPSATAPTKDGGAKRSPETAGERVTLNFVNADIEAVARAISVMVSRQIVVDPRVKGQVTLYAEQPIAVSEAYGNFLTALRGQGFALVESNGLLKILPEPEAKIQTGTVSVDQVSKRGDQVLTQIFRLNHEAANNLVPVLRPLISPNNTINVSAGNNSLIITDYADNLQRIAKIVSALDLPVSTDIEVVPLKHSMASDLAPVVQRVVDGTSGAAGAPGTAGASGSNAITVLADPRTNSLILKAPNASKLAQVKAAVTALDKPLQGQSAAGNIWVIYLKNADATRLAAVLRAAFAANGTPSSTGGSGAGSGGLGLTGSTLPTPSAATATPNSGLATSSAVGGGSAQSLAPVQASAAPSLGGFIQADPASNSLIITAGEPLYKQIRAVVDQLDSRRAQIYVESLIVKIDASKAAEFGIQWQGLLGQKGDRNLLVGGTNFGSGGNNIINLQLGAASGNLTSVPGAGLNLGFVRKFGDVYGLASLARFLESEAGANVLSTPNLVALDNEEAKIVIGQNVPFVTGTFTNVSTGTGAVNPFQTIERRDVGLTLRIKSQIGEGGTVRMQVFQENSTVVPGATTSAGPTTDKSSIETSVVVDDGQIIVLGGLLKDEFSDGQDRVPLFGQIPGLGALFRNENRKRNKTNLMVFLRPVVLRNQLAADNITLDRYQNIRAQQEQMQPSATPILPIEGSPLLPAMSNRTMPSAGR